MRHKDKNSGKKDKKSHKKEDKEDKSSSTLYYSNFDKMAYT